MTSSVCDSTRLSLLEIYLYTFPNHPFLSNECGIKKSSKTKPSKTENTVDSSKCPTCQPSYT